MTKGDKRPALIIIMGTSGSGKSTVGNDIAASLNVQFIDGDDLHPQSNVDKMSRGEPLTDEDRGPWLKVMHRKAQEITDGAHDKDVKRPVILIACSALKKIYRDTLRGDEKVTSDTQFSPIKTYFLYLKGSQEALQARMSARKGHFMTERMLNSQLQTLEEPEEDETDVRVVDIDKSREEVAEESIAAVKSLLEL
ncbi:shikimate kinase [Wallemia mellicola]|uniref:Gluconokinase n=1 Tax=Wallemia mellicola TaxID=1708541 RepID=A0A4T0M4U1_9BASI|nr:hypothetical protein E3Q23_01134 [Wallemia mellicola]TIB80995.1 shikimate kinase [Wallemia mellicola]TIC06133.1 shikimate kinase [Wallemia mellicola]TIC23063.1 shikimate kinase [Wallemia mellicola]TIC36188.1 shikimate kinase [Wallemia mellicola]